MQINFRFLIFLLFFLSSFSFASSTSELKSATIEFSGPQGSKAVMNFNISGNNYYATTSVKVLIFNMTFKSQGKVSNGQLIPTSYQDIRNGSVYAETNFDYKKKQVIYGKPKQKNSIALKGTQYDFFSLPWQMVFDVEYLTRAIQLTNGKSIYFKNKQNIKQIQSIINNSSIKTNKGQLDVSIYQINKLFPGQDKSLKFGFSKKYYDLPVYIQFQSGKQNYNLYVKSIQYNGKKIF